MNHKIFQIGFNRSATQALRALFLMSGYRAVHNTAYNQNFKRMMPIAETFDFNLKNNLNLILGIENYHYYGDIEAVMPKRQLVLQGYTLFERLDKENKNAIFILNTRPLESWIYSRLTFDRTYLLVYQKYYGLSKDEAINFWIDHYLTHTRNVKNYFKDRPDKLIEFNVESDKIEDFIEKLERLNIKGLDKQFWQNADFMKDMSADLKKYHENFQAKEKGVDLI